MSAERVKHFGDRFRQMHFERVVFKPRARAGKQTDRGMGSRSGGMTAVGRHFERKVHHSLFGNTDQAAGTRDTGEYVLHDRAALIDKGVEYAQNAKLQLDNAQQEHDKIVGEARTKQADILREADRLKTQIVEEARNEAKTAAQKEMEAARQSIAQQQKQAETQLRQQLGQLVLDVAGRVVRNKVDNSEAQSKLVNTYLDEIENGGKASEKK